MATSNNISLLSPMELRGDPASNRQFFKEQWEDYINTAESARKDESIKAALLRTVIGRDCLKVLKSLNLSSTESQDSKGCLLNLLKDYERFKFYTCDQGPNELVDQWLTRIRHL